jgi:hypothetical protein
VKDSRKPEPYEVARIEALRALCQGTPVLWPGKVKPSVPQETLDLFYVEDSENFIRLLKKGLDLMLDSPYKQAMEFALGHSSGEDTLTERRNALLNLESTNVSYRTLVRHEQEGARRLAHLMVDTSGSESVTSTREALDSLEDRVKDLELTVRGLSALSRALIEQLQDRKKLDAYKLQVAMHGGKPSELFAEHLFMRARAGVKVRADEHEERLREQGEDEEDSSLPDDAD